MDDMIAIISQTEMEYQCYECGHIEETLFELSQHVKKEHPDEAAAVMQTPQHIFIVRKFFRINSSKRILVEELPAVMP